MEVLIVVKHLFESVEVEGIANVLFVNLTKELMILKVAKPADPTVRLLGGVRLSIRHHSILIELSNY